MLSRFERFKLHVAANRRVYGGILTALAIVFRVRLSFEGHNEVAELLDMLALGVGTGTWAAGQFKSDKYHKENKELLKTLPPTPTTGLLDLPKPAIVPRRRASDARSIHRAEDPYAP